MSNQYDSLINSAAQSAGIDPYVLKGLLMSESSMNPTIVSHDKNGNPVASGIAQFTPDTARSMGVTDPMNPSQAIPAAARLLRQNLDQNHGDYSQAIATYKAGSDRSGWGPITTSGTMKALQYADQYRSQAVSSTDPLLSFMNSNSKPAGQAGGWSSCQQSQQQDPLLAFMNQNHGQPAQQPQAQPSQPQSGAQIGNQVAAGVGEGLLHYGSQAVSMPLSGLAGAAKFVTSGGDIDQAAATQNNVANALTYQPRTAGGKVGAQIAELPGRALSAVADYAGRGTENVANALGASPGTSNALRSLTSAGVQALPVLLGARSALKGRAAPAEGDMVEPAGVSSANPTETPQASAPEAAQPSATPPAQTVAGRGSAGAAGTPYAAQAQAQGIPDAIVQNIARQERAGTLNQTAAERHIEAGSLPVPVELTAGQATGDVNILSQEQNLRGQNPALAQRFNAQNGQLAANLEAIRDQVAPDVNVPSGTALDQALVDAYKQMDEPIRQSISAKYQALRDANGGEFPLSGQDFVSAADAALKKDNKAYFVPSQVQSLLSDFRDGGPMTYNDFESMRTILANEARKAERAGDGNAAHAVSLVRDSLESLPMSNETAAIRPLADDARAAARARFQAMGADPAYKAAVNDGVAAGEPSPVADGFIQKYVVRGKTANVQNMLQNLASDPTSQQIVSAGLVDHIKSQAGIDLRTGSGNISQAGINKALQQLDQKTGIVLGQSTARTLDTIGNVARYTQEQPRGSYVNNSNTFVAGAASAAKSAMEGAANVYAHGIPVGSWTRQALQRRSTAKEVSRSLEPGAGMKLSSLAKRQADKR